jgi:hypothetical protein
MAGTGACLYFPNTSATTAPAITQVNVPKKEYFRESVYGMSIVA